MRKKNLFLKDSEKKAAQISTLTEKVKADGEVIKELKTGAQALCSSSEEQKSELVHEAAVNQCK